MRRNIKTLLTNPHGRVPLRLFTQRSADADSAPELWSLIGGCAQAEETTEQAARRLMAERVGLVDQSLTCLYEWVESGLSTPVPGLRSLWVADTNATTEDLTIDVVRAGAFMPDQQIPRLPVTDTTAIALHLALPYLIPTVEHTPAVRGVILDRALPQQNAGGTALALHNRAYVLGSVTTHPNEPVTWPTRVDTGDADAVSPDTLLHGRPDPDLYRVAARQLGLDAAECVFVSADRLQLIAASVAGAIPIRAASTQEPEPNSRIHAETEPWPVISSLEDLLDLLPT